jgi:hypothetical protein
MSAESLERVWGCGDPDELFGVSPRTTTPWVRGGKDKRGATYDLAAVQALCANPVDLVDIDPREVRCTQPWLLREHVEYYLTGQWELSGRTSADQHREENRFPIIVADRLGRLVILTGHHRTAAALIEGRPVRARIAAVSDAYLVTPRVVVDPGSSLAESGAQSPSTSSEQVVARTLDDAAAMLKRRGVSADDISAAIGSARRRAAASTQENSRCR